MPATSHQVLWLWASLSSPDPNPASFSLGIHQTASVIQPLPAAPAELRNCITDTCASVMPSWHDNACGVQSDQMCVFLRHKFCMTDG
ncbi:hypothetical protein AVEN_85384-1 [Araneus ventricosus]|uniref:Uncharacterized protein n=1 Tax=Araneus ventricosus TaxID=182803 RepID=A0A4Y2SDI1_ARAVE|nr:hypothetical protein AVEN_85384-1 [Araneus ventricosus]